MAGIDELLAALQNPNEDNAKLRNDFDTWSRIGRRDSFDELNMDKSELDEFLSEWVGDNPYENI